jgi:hypothetical protein
MTRLLFHRTTGPNARAILRSGFRDGAGHYMTTGRHSGVWLSDRPLDANEGAIGEVLLEIETALSDSELDFFEWKEEGKGYREFMVPAEPLNALSEIRWSEE